MEGVVESKEEMKKKMERKKGAKVKGISPDKGEQIKVKEKSPDKGEEIKVSAKEKYGDVKEGLGDVKEGTKEKYGDVKEGAKEKYGEVKESLGDVKEETKAQTERLQRESEAEGRNPAEKFLSDMISGFRQKTDEVNQAMTERTGVTATPLTDIIETNQEIIVISDIPGLDKDKIEIGITPSTVEITATYLEQPPTIENPQFIQKERGYGAVHRIINLPAQIEVNQSKANYKNCTLTINLPKKQKTLTKITIEE